jgi:predicted AAA+ superfamily ATPase
MIFQEPLGVPKISFKDNPVTQEYEEKAKNLLKAELKRRGLTYASLATRLAVIGIQETERNLANKISRGGFTAAFLLQCLQAMGAAEISLRS